MNKFNKFINEILKDKIKTVPTSGIAGIQNNYLHALNYCCICVPQKNAYTFCYAATHTIIAIFYNI